MTLIRTTSAALLALFISHQDAAVAHASASAAQTTRAQAGTPRIKKVYDPKAGALSSGALMNAGNAPHLSQAQYDTLKYVTKEVIKRFPPATSYYFGLGRSPACIVSMIQNLAADEKNAEQIAMNFPASGMHDGQPHDDASYFRHFDALIPKEVLSGNRTIVLLDRSRPYSGASASGGESLHVFKGIMERYLKARGSSVKVEGVGFSYGSLNPNYGLHHIPFDLNTQNELETVSMPHYEAIAEYPHHRIGPGLQVPARRGEYTKYKGFMLERMKRDAEFDAFLDKYGGTALRGETAEEKQARVAEEKAQQALADQATAAERLRERAEQAKALRGARNFPTEMKTSLGNLVSGLPQRADSHDSGPYLSESAEAMNGWLQKTLATRAEVEGVVPAVKRAGPNLVVSEFMDAVEQARKEKKLRNRDYRRLMGHAMSAAVMDAAMVKSLVQRFENSRHFRREIVEESDYYLNYGAKKGRPDTVNMAASYQTLVQHLPAASLVPEAKE